MSVLIKKKSNLKFVKKTQSTLAFQFENWKNLGLFLVLIVLNPLENFQCFPLINF